MAYNQFKNAKQEKNAKGKYQAFNVNNSYTGSTVAAPKSQASRQHGLQSLGKVTKMRRGPLSNVQSQDDGDEGQVYEQSEDTLKIDDLPPNIPVADISIPPPSTTDTDRFAGKTWSTVTRNTASAKAAFIEQDSADLVNEENKPKVVLAAQEPSLRPKNTSKWTEGAGAKSLETEKSTGELTDLERDKFIREQAANQTSTTFGPTGPGANGIVPFTHVQSQQQAAMTSSMQFKDKTYADFPKSRTDFNKQFQESGSSLSHPNEGKRISILKKDELEKFNGQASVSETENSNWIKASNDLDFSEQLIFSDEDERANNAGSMNGKYSKKSSQKHRPQTQNNETKPQTLARSDPSAQVPAMQCPPAPPIFTQHPQQVQAGVGAPAGVGAGVGGGVGAGGPVKRKQMQSGPESEPMTSCSEVLDASRPQPGADANSIQPLMSNTGQRNEEPPKGNNYYQSNSYARNQANDDRNYNQHRMQKPMQQSRQQRGPHDSRKAPMDGGVHRNIDTLHHHQAPNSSNNPTSTIQPLLDFSSMNDMSWSLNGKSDRVKHTSHTDNSYPVRSLKESDFFSGKRPQKKVVQDPVSPISADDEDYDNVVVIDEKSTIATGNKDNQASTPVVESTSIPTSPMPNSTTAAANTTSATPRTQDTWSQRRSGTRPSNNQQSSGTSNSLSNAGGKMYSDNNGAGAGANAATGNYTSLKTGAVSRRPTNTRKTSCDSTPPPSPHDCDPTTSGMNSAAAPAGDSVNSKSFDDATNVPVQSKSSNSLRSNKSSRVPPSGGQDRSKISSDVNTTVPWTIQNEKERTIDPINRRNNEKERRMKDGNFAEDIRDRRNDIKPLYKNKSDRNERKFDGPKNQDDNRPKYGNQNSYTRNEDRPKFGNHRDIRDTRTDTKYQDTRSSNWQNPPTDLSAGEWGNLNDNTVNKPVASKSKTQYEDKLEKWSSNESLSKSPKPVTPPKTTALLKPVDTSKMAKLNSKDTPAPAPVIVDTTTRDAPLPTTNIWKSRSDEKQRLKDEEESKMRAARDEARMNHRNNQQHRQPNNNSGDLNYRGGPNNSGRGSNIYDQEFNRRNDESSYRRNDNRDFRLDDSRGFRNDARTNDNRFNRNEARNNRIEEFPYRDIRETQRPMRDQRNQRQNRYDNDNNRDYPNEPYPRDNNYRENRNYRDYNKSSRDFRLDEKNTNNQRNEDRNRKDNRFSEERTMDDKRNRDVQNEDRTRQDNERPKMDDRLMNEKKNSEERNMGDQSTIEKKQLISQLPIVDSPENEQVPSDKPSQKNDDKLAREQRNSNRQRNNELPREQRNDPRHQRDLRNDNRAIRDPRNARFHRDTRIDDRQVQDTKRNDDLRQNRDQRNDDRQNRDQRNNDRQNRDQRNDDCQRIENRQPKDQCNDDIRHNRDYRNDNRQYRDQRNDNRQYNRDQRNENRQIRDQRNDNRQNRDQRLDDRQNRDPRQGEPDNRELRQEDNKYPRNQKYDDKQKYNANKDLNSENYKKHSTQTCLNQRDNEYQRDGNRPWESGNQRSQPYQQRDNDNTRRDYNPRTNTRRDDRPTLQTYQAKGMDLSMDTRRKNPDMPREGGRRKYDNRKGSNNSDEACNIKNVRIPSNSSEIATEEDKLKKKHKDITVYNAQRTSTNRNMKKKNNDDRKPKKDEDINKIQHPKTNYKSMRYSRQAQNINNSCKPSTPAIDIPGQFDSAGNKLRASVSNQNSIETAGDIWETASESSNVADRPDKPAPIGTTTTTTSGSTTTGTANTSANDKSSVENSQRRTFNNDQENEDSKRQPETNTRERSTRHKDRSKLNKNTNHVYHVSSVEPENPAGISKAILSAQNKIKSKASDAIKYLNEKCDEEKKRVFTNIDINNFARVYIIDEAENEVDSSRRGKSGSKRSSDSAHIAAPSSFGSKTPSNPASSSTSADKFSVEYGREEDNEGFHEVVSKRVLKIKKQAAIDEAEAKTLLAEQAEAAKLAKKAKRANRSKKDGKKSQNDGENSKTIELNEPKTKANAKVSKSKAVKKDDVKKTFITPSSRTISPISLSFQPILAPPPAVSAWTTPRNLFKDVQKPQVKATSTPVDNRNNNTATKEQTAIGSDTKPRKLTNKDKVKARKEKLEASKRPKNSTAPTAGATGAGTEGGVVRRPHDRPVRYSEQNRQPPTSAPTTTTTPATASSTVTDPARATRCDVNGAREPLTSSAPALSPRPVDTRVKYQRQDVNSQPSLNADALKPEPIACKPTANTSPVKKDSEAQLSKFIYDSKNSSIPKLMKENHPMNKDLSRIWCNAESSLFNPSKSSVGDVCYNNGIMDCETSVKSDSVLQAMYGEDESNSNVCKVMPQKVQTTLDSGISSVTNNAGVLTGKTDLGQSAVVGGRAGVNPAPGSIVSQVTASASAAPASLHDVSDLSQASSAAIAAEQQVLATTSDPNSLSTMLPQDIASIPLPRDNASNNIINPQTSSLSYGFNLNQNASSDSRYQQLSAPAPPGGATQSTIGSIPISHAHYQLPIGASLTSAQLTSAQLTSAQLTSAQLNSAQLTPAQLTSAQLTSAQLTSAQMTPGNHQQLNTGLLPGNMFQNPDMYLQSNNQNYSYRPHFNQNSSTPIMQIQKSVTNNNFYRHPLVKNNTQNQHAPALNASSYNNNHHNAMYLANTMPYDQQLLGNNQQRLSGSQLMMSNPPYHRPPPSTTLPPPPPPPTLPLGQQLHSGNNAQSSFYSQQPPSFFQGHSNNSTSLQAPIHQVTSPPTQYQIFGTANGQSRSSGQPITGQHSNGNTANPANASNPYLGYQRQTPKPAPSIIPQLNTHHPLRDNDTTYYTNYAIMDNNVNNGSSNSQQSSFKGRNKSLAAGSNSTNNNFSSHIDTSGPPPPLLPPNMTSSSLPPPTSGGASGGGGAGVHASSSSMQYKSAREEQMRQKRDYIKGLSDMIESPSNHNMAAVAASSTTPVTAATNDSTSAGPSTLASATATTSSSSVDQLAGSV